MKETYITPAIELVEEEAAMLLAGSGVSADGIGYGGIDTDGSVDPESRLGIDFDY